MIQLPQNTNPFVLLGDVLKCLKEIPSESISTIVTSPPYWNLRDYYKDGQIGHEKTPEEYIEKLAAVSKELLRVLKKNGAYFLNIGDTYLNKGLQMIPQRLASKMTTDIKITTAKKIKVGWLLRNQIIWYKPNHMPSPVKCRFTNTYEPIYFFTRDDWERRVYLNIDKLRIPHKSNGDPNNFNLPKYIDEKDYPKIKNKIESLQNKINYNGKFKNNEKNIGASPGGRSSVTGIRYIKKRKNEIPQNVICDYLRFWWKKSRVSVKEIDKKLGYAHTSGHWFRKDAGGSIPLPEDWTNLKKILGFSNKYDKAMTEMHYVLQTVSNNPKGKNPGDLWEMNTAKLSEAHFAVFPEELPKRAIKACCPPDGIVLDPFAGSGTTGIVAKELNRKSILIELQNKFLKIIKKRCGDVNVIRI